MKLTDEQRAAGRMNNQSAKPTLYHVGLSGGKDSSALLIWMANESGIPHDQIRASFCDTGNEADETYEQVRLLSERVLPVEWIKPELDFYELARKKKRFPSTKARFCTQELKMKPTAKYLNTLIDEFEVIAVSGVRADESLLRSKLSEWGDPMESYFGVKEWRPLLKWTIVEVVAIHKKYGIPMNPLYAKGAQRVGCFPCIMSRKSEIRNIVKHFPERIDRIRAEEQRAINEYGRVSTFFPAKKLPKAFRSFSVILRDGTTVKVATIDDVVAWSQTKDGKQSKGQMTLEFWHEDEICPTTFGACE